MAIYIENFSKKLGTQIRMRDEKGLLHIIDLSA